jgi:hypothetical protein
VFLAERLKEILKEYQTQKFSLLSDITFLEMI